MKKIQKSFTYNPFVIIYCISSIIFMKVKICLGSNHHINHYQLNATVNGDAFSQYCPALDHMLHMHKLRQNIVTLSI